MASRTITLNVTRFDPEEEQTPTISSYLVPVSKGVTVLDALFYVLENLDDSLAFRYSCRGAVCGACGMSINGELRLACQTQVSELGETVSVGPLHQATVIRDLVVDMDPFWERIERVRPYLTRKSPVPEREILQAPKDLEAIDEIMTCMLCGICDAGNPAVWELPERIGPAAMVRVGRFVLDSRDEARAERLAQVADEHGVLREDVDPQSQSQCPKRIDVNSVVEKVRQLAQSPGRVE